MTPNSQELLEFLYRSPIALVNASSDGEIQLMTPLACQWLMPLSEDGQLANLYKLLQEQVPDLADLVTQGPSNIICENVLLKVGGASLHSRHLSLTVHRFSDTSVAAIFTDVSSEHRQIDEAQQGLRALRQALQSSPIAVRVSRLLDGQVLFVNRAFSTLVLSRNETIDVTDSKCLDLDRSVFADVTQRLQNGEVIQSQLTELNLTGKEAGQQHWALASYRLIDYEDQRAVLTWLYDVTELQRAKQASEEAYVAKGRFLANMSHEIRTPMNAILGMMQLLENTELNARQQDYTTKASGAVQGLLGLIDDILDFSKVDAGRMELECQPFQLETLMRNLSVVLSSNVNKANEVLFDMDPLLPNVVSGDAQRLQQVLINLGGNAIKFTESGQVVIAVKLVSSNDTSVRISFAVTDSGIGIAPEQHQRIFTGFSQAEASTNRRFGGTGLGLSISKSLVDLMGGSLSLQSEPGRGSTFSFVIELEVVDATPIDLRHLAPAQSRPRQALIIDDNPISRQLLMTVMRASGWVCTAVGSGAEALSAVKRELENGADRFPYPLVLVDWQMPDTDGWETCRLIMDVSHQCAGPAPVVLMLSDNGRHDLSKRSTQEQALINGFVVKPFTPAMIVDAVKAAHSNQSGLRKRTEGRTRKRQLAGMRILVVEDNLINQQIAEELLSAEGASVSLAANGRLGVEAVRNAAPQFDVVLMDVQMPVMDGFEATLEIRNVLGLSPSQLPVIAMTANAMSSDRDACLTCGMNDHVGKPFDIAHLVSLLIRITGITPSGVDDVGASLHEKPSAALLPSVEGVELSMAMARMSGSKSLYIRTAKDFLKALPVISQELNEIEKHPERKWSMSPFHFIKGNAGTLGLKDLAQVASRLDQLYTAGPAAPSSGPHFSELIALIDEAQSQLKQVILVLDTSAVASQTV